MKQQVLVIHGGDTFGSHEEYLRTLKNFNLKFDRLTRAGWKENLRIDLGEKFEVILPQMPNAINARYEEWKIIFEKIFPFLHDGIILVGHSLGGVFIAKHLAENKFPHKIKATFLISAPFASTGPEYNLLSFSLPANLSWFAKQAGEIHIFHSSDDTTVPSTDADKYKQELTGATIKLFTDRGHFSQERLPELAEEIRKL